MLQRLLRLKLRLPAFDNSSVLLHYALEIKYYVYARLAACKQTSFRGIHSLMYGFFWGSRGAEKGAACWRRGLCMGVGVGRGRGRWLPLRFARNLSYSIGALRSCCLFEKHQNVLAHLRTFSQHTHTLTHGLAKFCDAPLCMQK